MITISTTAALSLSLLLQAPILSLSSIMTTFASVFEPTRLPLSFTSRHVVGGRRGVGLSRSAALVPVVRAVDGRATLNGHVATTKQEMMDSAKGGVGVEEKRKSTVVNDFGPSQSDSAAVADLGDVSVTRKKKIAMSDVGNSTNIVWHDCPVGKLERQKLLGQKGCVLWITGLSGSGKSTLASALSRELYLRGFLSYVLDGDNLRHGLNNDLSFKAEHRAENIRRTGEVAKLFADTGVICIASLISPYRRDRDACRELLQPDGNFIEVFMDMPLEVCEARDPKGLYKLARAGKIKGFTGIDDPYEPPLYSEIVIQRKYDACPSPTAMAEEVIAYLEKEGYLKP